MFFAQSLINFADVLPLALFGAVAVGVWWVLNLFAADRPRAVERLGELKNPRARRNAEVQVLLREPDAVTRVLEKTSALAKPLQPKSEAEMGKLRLKLTVAGFRDENAVAIFLTLKFAGLLLGLFLGGGTVLGIKGINRGAMIWTGCIVGLLFYLPDIIVSLRGRSRRDAVFLALPDALDMLVVCVEAGLGLDQAMRRVSDEMKRTYRILSEEFAMTNFQLQMGRGRGEALHELGMRTGVADLRSLAGILIQADKFGSSIGHALRIQSESLRTRRRQMAEEKAAKTAVKLIFPLVMFIFPGIFVVLVGPAAIVMVREMFPKMAGQ